jgi:phytoene desaturase
VLEAAPRKAAVIGAGFGGLALAIRLQSAGIATTIVEARDKPGGRAYHWRKEGYVFDAGPTVITDPDCLKELWALSGSDIAKDVDLVSVTPFYRLNWPDGSNFDYTNDDTALKAQIDALQPGDWAGYQKFLAYSAGVFREGYQKLGAVPFLDFSMMLKAAPALARYQAWRSVYSVVAGFVKSEKLRQALSFHTLLVGGNPMTTSSIYALIHKLERDGGVWFAKGGTNQLIAGMVRHFERIGGTIRLGDPVTDIAAEGGRVKSVATRSGWRERFDAVASNGDVVTTYGLVSGHQRGQREQRRLGNRRFSPSLFVVHFGARGLWPEVRHHSILFGPRYQGLLSDIYKGGTLASDPVALPAPPDGDGSGNGAGGLLQLLRAGSGAASGEARRRLGRGGAALSRPDPGGARAAHAAGPAGADRGVFPLYAARLCQRSRRASRFGLQPGAGADAERVVPRPQSRRQDPEPLLRRGGYASGSGYPRRGRERQGDGRADDR